MPNLFIIGNGFDLSHGLKTRYSDFYDYLTLKYPSADGECLVIPEGHANSDGGYDYDEIEVVNLIKCLLTMAEGTEDWSDIETSVGNLDYALCLDDVENVYDRDDEIDPWKTSYAYEDFSTHLIDPLSHITKLFEDWIRTIKIKKTTNSISSFSKLVNPRKDYFLTFNYTKTLETLYHITKICHIHGKLGEKIYFGHNINRNYFEETNLPIGAENAIQHVHDSLKKDTASALSSNMHFFKSLNMIQNIYSMGFSFSNVDLVYINEICKCIDTEKVVWNLHNFDIDKHINYKSKIRTCGFKGKFNSFST